VSILLTTQARQPSQTRGSLNLLRKDGWIPAVVYGNKSQPQTLSVFGRQFLKEMETPGLRTRVFDLGGDLGLVLVKDMAFHPTKDCPIHIDFLRLSERVQVSVSLRFINEDKSPGLKRGGVLNVIHFSLEISAPSIAIPQEICIDLDGRDIGNTIHLHEVPLPEGVTILNLSGDESIVSIVAPSGLTESLKDGGSGA
jgi:large subunit ribosomal protein L25